MRCKYNAAAQVLRSGTDSTGMAVAMQRLVCFVPESFTAFPAHLDGSAAAALAEHRSTLLQSLLRDLDAADCVTTNVYNRFRLLWILARDNPALQPGADQLRLLRRHSNLFAPVGTHDPKALSERMQRCVLPAGDAIAAAASATPAAGASAAPSKPVLSRLQESLRTNGVGLLPQEPFSCSLSDAPAMSLTLLGAVVHAQACFDLDWGLDARTWTAAHTPDAWRAAMESACASVRQWLLAHISQRHQFALFLLRCFRELMPPRTTLHLLRRCLPFDWQDLSFQDSIVATVLRDPGLAEFPPDAEHSFACWSALLTSIEQAGVDVDDELSLCVQRLLKLKSQRALATNAQPAPAHWTVTYRPEPDAAEEEAVSADGAEIELRTCTLRMELGFSCTTGVRIMLCCRRRGLHLCRKADGFAFAFFFLLTDRLLILSVSLVSKSDVSVASRIFDERFYPSKSAHLPWQESAGTRHGYRTDVSVFIFRRCVHAPSGGGAEWLPSPVCV